MPNIKAAIKWVRQTEKRTLRNLDMKSRLKTFYKKAKAANDPTMTSFVESQFDKAARKGIIHKNKAARKKARLIRAVRVQAVASAAAAAAASTAATAKAAKSKKK